MVYVRSHAQEKGHEMTGFRYTVNGRRSSYQPVARRPIRYMLNHSEGVEYAPTLRRLDFSIPDPFSVWSVHVDYDKYQVCIGMVCPAPFSVGDAVYAVGTDPAGVCQYVNGTVFLPGVVRTRLLDLSDRGEFITFHFGLLRVVAKPVMSGDGLLALQAQPA